MVQSKAQLFLAELAEFARLDAMEQYYVQRSLDIAFGRGDYLLRWARSEPEADQIRSQASRYRGIEALRALIEVDNGLGAVETFMAPLIAISLGDLADGRIATFAAYRFLYERLLGPEARPWLLSGFLAAAMQPGLHPEFRRQLLQSVASGDAAAAGWAAREPLFFPQWIEKETQTVD